MKNLLSILIISSVLASCTTSKKSQSETIPVGDTSKTSLDWQGVYSAIIPFEKSDSTRFTIHLLDENNYILSRTLQKEGSKTFHEQGKFLWNKEGSSITLKSDNSKSTTSFLVGENVLMMLNEKGERKSEKYFLQKQETELKEKYWKVVELSGVQIIWKHENQREPHIIFRSFENQFNGNSGCNTFSGSYELLTGNEIMLSQVMATKMYCEGTMTVEDQLFQILEKVNGYSVIGDALSFTDKEGNSIAKFEAVYF